MTLLTHLSGPAEPETVDRVLLVEVLQRFQRGRLRPHRQQEVEGHPTRHVLTCRPDVNLLRYLYVL